MTCFMVLARVLSIAAVDHLSVERDASRRGASDPSPSSSRSDSIIGRPYSVPLPPSSRGTFTTSRGRDVEVASRHIASRRHRRSSCVIGSGFGLGLDLCQNPDFNIATAVLNGLRLTCTGDLLGKSSALFNGASLRVQPEKALCNAGIKPRHACSEPSSNSSTLSAPSSFYLALQCQRPMPLYSSPPRAPP